MTDPSDDPARRERAEALFEDALELPLESRAGFVARACGSDEGMAAQVMELLRAHDREAGILDARPAGENLRAAATSERLGPYRILHRLGSGGMADVYLAVREDAFMRRVALKIMRGQSWGETSRQRFETERQIMASLSHPNIARLLDGGMTDEGVPYLVMEHVEGLPLTEYCDRQGLTVPERLSLFRKVCTAVHHAHQNLVIHRDLKPSNILVTTEGEPKLLDFGIAKLQQPASPGLPQPVTIPNLRALTPQYASPEQVRGDPLTTASDVYSLGVILYEILTGLPPFPLKDAAPAEALRAISELDPKPPSVSVRPTDGTAEDRERRASTRGTTPDGLVHRLRGDLDAIVMTALRKEPGRRYGSVEQLSSDLDRHLSGEAVLAVGSGRAYRLGKFLKRHRIEATAGAAGVVFLVVGLMLALWQAGVAREERDRANQALQQAQASSDFLLGLFQADDPRETLADTISARTMLERGLAEVDALDAYPELRARLLTVLGRAHHSLGAYDRAAELLGTAVRELEGGGEEPLSPDAAAELARTLAELADVLRTSGDYAEALARARQAHDLRARHLGADHPEVATSLIQIASLLVYEGDLAGADSLARTALAMRRASLGTDDPAVTNALEAVAALALRRGDADEAERLLRETVARRRRTEGPEAPEHATALLRLAELLTGVRGAHSEAEAVYRRALAILAASEPDRATALAGLAEAVAAQGRRDEGIRLYQEAIEARTALFSPTHASVADLLNGLGGILVEAGDLREAEDTYRRALDIWEARLGPEHPAVAYGLSGLARVAAERDDWDRAETLARQALAVRQDALADANVLIVRSQTSLGEILGARSEFEEADSLLQAALTSLRRELPPDHREVRAVHAGLARLYDRWGKPEAAARHRALGGGPPPGRDHHSP